MSTYKATITFRTSKGDSTFVVDDVVANSVSGAFGLAMDDFFRERDMFEIKKIEIELLQSTWKATGDILLRKPQ